ncbi:MAG: hypothetical protein HRT41_06585 [Campylobacteraceae bacterium]|nr:hypothetical protein [Campylobacteraceae bacterium]
MIKNILLVLCTAVLFQGCFEEVEDKWSAFIYPDPSNTKRFLILEDTTKDLKKCQELAKSYLIKENLDLATYKCGLHCVYNEKLKSNICEEMN